MEPRDKDRAQFDQLLDSALRRYGNVEPRPGLEGRVLARLAAEASRSHGRAWWVWGLAGAAAMIVVIGMWIGGGHRRSNTPAVSVRPNVSKREQKLATVMPPVELNKPAVRRVRSLKTAAPVRMAKIAEPRLQQFPSPRPLSQQETVIAEYVQHFPEEAKLISQEQQKFDEEVQNAQQQIENNRNPDNLER
jgi:hypothetical protein